MELHQKNDCGDDEDDEPENRQRRVCSQSGKTTRIIRQVLTLTEFRTEDLSNLGKDNESATGCASHQKNYGPACPRVRRHIRGLRRR